MKISINKDKRYETITSIICFIVLVILIIFMALIQEAQADTKEVSYKYCTVKKGEVLEDIAKRYYSGVYLPEAKCEIKKLNNMTKSDIYEGQVLKVEVK